MPAVELAVSELVSNALLHGTGAIEVELHRFPDRARLVVHDAGAAGVEGPAVRDPSGDGVRPGGWGLRLVDEVAGRWGVISEAGHTQVWMETRPTGRPDGLG